MRLQKVMGWCIAQCKMLLFCAKTVVKESHNSELRRRRRKEEDEKKKKKNILAIL